MTAWSSSAAIPSIRARSSARRPRGPDPLAHRRPRRQMRTIVLVPDRDVPYCKVGDPATVHLDALAGRVFKAKVSRIAESEDLKDRTMRVEIDIDNSDHALRDGMFGRAEILLEKLIKNLTIPSSCLAQRNGKGEGAVFVVKNGELRRVPFGSASTTDCAGRSHFRTERKRSGRPSARLFRRRGNES